MNNLLGYTLLRYVKISLLSLATIGFVEKVQHILGGLVKNKIEIYNRIDIIDRNMIIAFFLIE